MALLREGNAPVIMRGPYRGVQAIVCRIIPVSICPEPGNCIYNLEFGSKTLNEKEADKVKEWQVQLARKWHGLGLLSREGLDAVEAAVTHAEKGRDPG